MRKTMTALLLAMTLPTLAMAAPADDHRPDGPGPGPRMFHELNLTKDQQGEVRKLMMDQRKSDRELIQRYLDKLPEADKKALESERKATRDKQQSAIRALLTPAQQKTFDEQVAKMKQRKAEREASGTEHKKAD